MLVKAAFANALPDDLLTDAIPIDRAKELFSRYVDQVEIENHSFCNRVCWFCPNAFIDRRSVSHQMPEHVFETIVGGLSEIDYAGALTWSRFHEALASVRIFERLAAARAALPRAGLVMISNGDYLNRKTLPRLEELGLDRLIIDLYMPDGRERDPGAIAAGLRKFSRRTGMALEPTGEFSYRVAGLGMKATVDIPLYAESNISTRGGLVEVGKLSSYRRRAACMAPIRHVVIDYNGKGMMCCQTRSDAPAHRHAIVGDRRIGIGRPSRRAGLRAVSSLSRSRRHPPGAAEPGREEGRMPDLRRAGRRTRSSGAAQVGCGRRETGAGCRAKRRPSLEPGDAAGSRVLIFHARQGPDIAEFATCMTVAVTIGAGLPAGRISAA